MKRLYLSDTVAGEISAWIASQRLVAGDRLPSVTDWMARLGVGRSTLREGLKKLEAEGVIQVINGKGIFVSEQKIFRIYSTLRESDARRRLLEMLEVRQVLEEKAIALATEHASPAQLDDMAHHLQRYRQARAENDFIGVHEADAAFHITIYRASGNEVLSELISTLHSELYVSWDMPEDRHRVFDDSFPHHETLLNAMYQRDVSAALKAFGELIETTRRNVQAMAATSQNTLPT